MKVVGLIFTKLSAEKKQKALKDFSIGTNVDIVGLTEESIVSSPPGEKPLKATFNYSIDYLSNEDKAKLAEIVLNGEIFISATPEEFKQCMDGWKKKEVPAGLKVPLFNLILKRGTPKAIELEDELSLPIHIPFPQIRPEKKGDKKDKK